MTFQPIFKLTLATITALVTCSCGEKEIPKRKPSPKEENFFKGVAPKIKASDLKNEMAGARTDFLRSFSHHEIPWQLWNKDLLRKANDAQLPVFALVCYSGSNPSRRIVTRLNANPQLRDTLAKNAVCTLIDTKVHPELGNLSYHLSSEIGKQTAFPMVICLSHEGMPLAWLPVVTIEDKALDRVISSAMAMITDIWSNYSEYAVLNSRRDNQERQKRFDFQQQPPGDKGTDKKREGKDGDPENPPISRNELFRRSTRQLSSLFSAGDKDLDNVGGLVPTSSVELLAIGSRSNLLTREVRERCRNASRVITRQIVSGALRDPLDEHYFYARSTNDWTLPSFGKNIESQAGIAAMLLKAGGILGDEAFTREGLNLLNKIESEWLTSSISCIIGEADKASPDTFLWSFEALDKLLSPAEMKLAVIAFSLKKEGNLPGDSDPLGTYYQLNTLRNRLSLDEVAKQLELTPGEAEAQLASIRRKLLESRSQNGGLFFEKTLALWDRLAVLEAMLARSSTTKDFKDLQSSIDFANKIIEAHWDHETGLTALKSPNGDIRARGRDHVATAFLTALLYQQTLDSKWLDLSLKIFDYTLENYSSENLLLAETIEEDRVIPLRQHNTSMVFGNSTLGLTDLTAHRLHALTGKPAYLELVKQHVIVTSRSMERSVVNHTDYVISCALGDPPLIAILQGNPTKAAARALLAELNSPDHLPYLAIQPEDANGLPPLPPVSGEASVVLTKAGKVIGQADSTATLKDMLAKIISGDQ
ncbi:MAG: DUF255 domain-containing protein [Akkermansiaceae bacterium]|jgi:uncharacterized protein YyaL (SSP411 family)